MQLYINDYFSKQTNKKSSYLFMTTTKATKAKYITYILYEKYNKKIVGPSLCEEKK